MSHVKLQSVGKRYGELSVMSGLDLEVEKGSFTALLGPSGCGKSTLLRMIAGLEEVTSGAIFISGREVTHAPAAKRGIAMVFQSYALYPHMSVKQNIAFSLSIAHAPRAEQERKVAEVAKILDLTELLDRKPAQLSGGQRQRVAIGRALVREPEVFLFDEPLSNLDAKLRVQMRLELARLHKELGTTMIYVTHDQIEAMTLADRIVVIDAGHIAQVGTPLELYNKPANRFVAAFIGSPAMNIVPVDLAARGAGQVEIVLEGQRIGIGLRDSSATPGAGPHELGIRPEHVTIEPENEGHLTGTVAIVEHLGNVTLAHVETALGTIVATGAGESPVAAGDKVRLALDVPRVHIFGPDGLVL